MRVEQDPIHRHKDVLAHTIAVVAKTRPDLIGAAWPRCSTTSASRRPGPSVRTACRSTTTRWSAPAWPATACRALRFTNEQVDDIGQLVYLHLRFHGYGDDVWTDSAVRRYVRDAGHLLDELNELTRCDCTTRNERKARMLARRMDALEARIAELREQEELAAIRPDLDGDQVMAHLGIAARSGGGRGAGDAARGPPRRGPARRRGGLPPPRRLVGRAPGRDAGREDSDALLPRPDARGWRGRSACGRASARCAGPPAAGSGSRTVSTRKFARPSDGEQLRDRARHHALDDRRCPSTSGCTRRSWSSWSTIAKAGWGIDSTSGCSGLQHAVDLAEHPVDVVHRHQPPHGQDRVDGVGADERQLGERRMVQLDPHVLPLARRRGRRRPVRRTRRRRSPWRPASARAMALWPAPQPRSRTRVPST